MLRLIKLLFIFIFAIGREVSTIDPFTVTIYNDLDTQITIAAITGTDCWYLEDFDTVHVVHPRMFSGF